MLKTLLYTGATVVVLVIALFSPLAGAIANIAAYLLNPIMVARGGPIARYQFLAATVFIVSVLIHRPRGAPRVAGEGTVLKALWLYLAIAVSTAFWAVASSQIVVNESYEFAKTVLIASLFVLVIRNERDLKLLMWACLFGAWHAGFMHTTGVDWTWVSGRYADEVGVVPDMQGSVMVLFLPSFLTVAILGRDRWERIFCWAGMPFVLNSIIETYQRSYFVALAGEAFLLLVLLPRRIVWRLAPVLAVGACLFFFMLTPQDYWDWMSTIPNPEEEGSAHSRFVINRASFEMLKDYPFGVGYENYTHVSPLYLERQYLTRGRRSAHNSFLSVACETGVPGFIAWAAALGGALWLLRRVRKAADLNNLTRVEIYAMGMEIGLYGWCLGGVFHSDHEVDPAYWFMALAVSFVRLQHQQRCERLKGDDFYEEEFAELDEHSPVAHA